MKVCYLDSILTVINIELHLHIFDTSELTQDCYKGLDVSAKAHVSYFF